MKPHYIILAVFFVFLCCHQTWAKGIIFQMYKMQDKSRDQLICLLPKDQTDFKIWTILDISITDFSDPKNKLKLASSSVQQPDMWVQTERNLTMEVGGGVSRYEASLEIRFSKESNSDLDKYLCEVTYMNLAGSVVKIHEVLKPNLPGAMRGQLTDNSQLTKITQIKELQDNLAESVSLLTNRSDQTDERVEILSDRMESFELAISNISCLLGKDDNKKQDVSKPKPGHVIANDSFTRNTEDDLRGDKKKEGSSPTMDVKPEEITLGITEFFQANCSFTASSTSEMTSLVTLTVSRSNDFGQSFQDLASITEFTPNIVNMLTTEKLQAEGFVNQSGESYIHLLWNYPIYKQGGLYQCSATGLDISGHIMILIDTTQVSVDEANVDDYGVMIQELTNYTKNLEQTISHLEEKLSERDNYTNDLEKRLSERDNYTNNLEKKLSERDNYTKGLEEKLSVCKDGTSPCYLLRNFTKIPMTYQGGKYYLSKGGVSDVQACINECQKCGGDLMVINNQDEFHVLESYLNTTTGVRFVVIAGTDSSRENTWVIPSTNKPLPYLNWAPGDPDGGSSQNCIALYSERQWKMIDYPCNISSVRSYTSYICEVTQT